jgi:hypothetical protein
MEFKWLMIFAAIAACVMFGSLAYSNYTQSECAIAYSDSDRSVEDITKICGVHK